MNGLTDSRFRVSVNLYGAPALSATEFRSYKQDLIIGASLQVSVPWRSAQLDQALREQRRIGAHGQHI